MKSSFKERLAYKFDNFMAKGPWALFLALLLVFLGGFTLIGGVRLFSSNFFTNDVDSGVSIWRIFLQLTDPGNMAQDNDSGWYIKVFAIISGMFGIVFFSAVIAFITTQLDLKLDELKKGKSSVVEKGHTLILGWSKEIADIIREFIIANESEKRANLVVLSTESKEDMDDFLAEEIKDRKTTNIITRSGNTASIASLNKVAITSAKSIIILPTCGSGASSEDMSHSDAHTIKSMLAIAAASKNSETPDTVAQIFYEPNRQVLTKLAPDAVTIVDPEDIVAKIAVQTSRSTGLAAVYSSLIGFDGCEFYFTNSDWSGLLFKDVHFHYEDGVAIGVRTAENQIIINPDGDYKLNDNDDIIILAEDDSTIKFQKKAVVDPASYDYKDIRIEQHKEKALIIGWNSKAETIIDQYFDYMEEDSTITVVLPLEDEAISSIVKGIRSKSSKINIDLVTCDLLDGEQLKNLNPQDYNSIIILTENTSDQERADASAINTLLLIRDIIEQSGVTVKPQIITEVLDSNNLELISHTGVDDAIISTKMVSKILAQIAEEPEILNVYNDIFQEEGSEIYLKPKNLYFTDIPKEITYGELIRAAQKRGEICIGYREMDSKTDIESEFGVVINPDKKKKVSSDNIETLIVIAEDEL